MTREWKPGTVALLDFEPFSWNQLPKSDVVAIATNNGDWVTQNGALTAGKVKNVRPLVVIDPEDREQVDRLLMAYLNDEMLPTVIAMQAALRSLVAPPRPDEPKGLGAVVEDDRGRKFVRVADFVDGWMAGCQWQRIGGDIDAVRNFGWDDIAAVRVLSEGVA